jgi:hypothetical protein
MAILSIFAIFLECRFGCFGAELANIALCPKSLAFQSIIRISIYHFATDGLAAFLRRKLSRRALASLASLSIFFEIGASVLPDFGCEFSRFILALCRELL